MFAPGMLVNVDWSTLTLLLYMFEEPQSNFSNNCGARHELDSYA